MKRRHLLALVILALVGATVLAMAPVRGWAALTVRTVEERPDTGGASGVSIGFRYCVRQATVLSFSDINSTSSARRSVIFAFPA